MRGSACAPDRGGRRGRAGDRATGGGTAGDRRIAQQGGAGPGLLEVERLGAGAELLEHRDLDAVDPHVERVGQGLEPQVAAEQVIDESRSVRRRRGGRRGRAGRPSWR